MSIPYIQSTMSSARAGADSFISYPFLDDGDTTTKVYTMACSQLAESYDATQIELDDTMTTAASAGVVVLPFPADSNAYFVGDTGHSTSGGMVEFQRTFANIPKHSRILTGSQNYSFPGWAEDISLAEEFFPLQVIMGITGGSYVWPSNIVTLTTSRDHILDAGGYAFINMSYTMSGDPTVHYVSASFNILSTPTPSTITVDLGRLFPDQQAMTIISGGLRASTLDTRPPLSRNSPTITETTYILPGVTSGFAAVDDVGTPPLFIIMDVTTGSSGSTASTATIPSKVEYKEMVANKAQIIIEASVDEWMGNIIKQTVKTIRAL